MGRNRNWLSTRVRNRMVIYTVDNTVLDGLLVDVANDGVVLLDVKVRSDDSVSLLGEVYVPREKVRFAQVLATP